MLNSNTIEIVSSKVLEKYPDSNRMLHFVRQIESMNTYSMYLSEGLMELKRIIFRRDIQDFTLNFLKDVWDTFILEGVTKEEMIAYVEDTYQLLKNDSQLSRVYGDLLPVKASNVPEDKEFISIYDMIFVQIMMLKLISLKLVTKCVEIMNMHKQEEADKQRLESIRRQREETLKQLDGTKGKDNGRK